MKRLFLALMLFLGCGFVPMNNADASGSNTVFLPVRLNDYVFTSALHDTTFSNSTLFNYFESAERNTMLIARVSPYVYQSAYYYTYYGYKVDLGFAAFETVTFQYYPTLNAILGVTGKYELVILLPRGAHATAAAGLTEPQ